MTKTYTVTETEVRFCEAEIFRATWTDPAEYCENEAEEGRDYCSQHVDPDDYDYEIDLDDYDVCDQFYDGE